jgi:hypothetical protein
VISPREAARLRFLAAGSCLLLASAPARAEDTATISPDRLRLAERIYREGVLPSGQPLRGVRPGGPVEGELAACVLCHRRSGMGTYEGNRVLPPITGQFLFQPRAAALSQLDGGFSRGPDWANAAGRHRPREPYTDQTLVAALRSGAVPGGLPLDELMPRYALDDADARLLVEYLRGLSSRWSPGVTRDALHLATVVTPGVDPARRAALVDVLQTFVAVRNSGAQLERLRERGYGEAAHITYRTWVLHLWQLSGPPSGWEAQLAAQYRRQPVFALLSGVSEGNFSPVQRFCEKERLPCWFPTVDLPQLGTGDYYTTYFSAGVLLEAEVLARRLLDEHRATRVVQIRGPDEAAAVAAKALARALEGQGPVLEERVLRTVDAAALRRALGDARSTDAFVLWLRAGDVALLAQVQPPAAPVYFSAILARGEHAPLPAPWRANARLVYPFELPDRRRSTSARFTAWLKNHNLRLVDERLQADAYLAAQLLAEKVDEMLESLYRDYLLDRAEAKLSERLPTVIYHRLSLGPGQRFATKGGYIARFASPAGSELVAETEWIVP